MYLLVRVICALFFILLNSVQLTTAINLLPCTDNVDDNNMAAGGLILEDATPPGYTFQELHPVVQTGRNPHRWIGIFSRNDNHYDYGCAYITDIRNNFRRICPQGSEVSQIAVLRTPGNNRIQVEFLVNCLCTRIPRRRRSVSGSCSPGQYTREYPVCSNINKYKYLL